MKSKSWFNSFLSGNCMKGMAALGMLTVGAPAVYAAAPEMNIQAEQTKKVTGTVVDATGEPVIGATITEKGTSNGVITDFDGNFSINVPANATLVVSYIGYASQEVSVAGKNVINVTLQDDAQLIDEVVVTALGMKRATKALGYAVTELKGDDLNHNVINPVSALQGKVAGVDIAAGDGGLFGSSKILIRGNSTLGKNNQPIYVVDGVILDNAVKNGDADWSQSDTDWGNELKNLNPDDFESVSVLKGAAATALYGSRGLNGAVVITTKSGKGKKGLGISFTQTVGFDVVTGGPAFQNYRGAGYMAGYVNNKPSGNMNNQNDFLLNAEGKPTYINQLTYDWGPKFDGREIEYEDYTYRPYLAAKNNFTDAFDTGFNTNTNVSVQGGNDTSSFYTSLSYRYAEGNTPNNQFDRFSFMAKASHKISKDVEVEAGITFANSNPKQNGNTNFGENFVNGNWDRMYDSRYWRTRYKGSHGGLASSEYGDEWAFAPGRDVWWSIYEVENTHKETTVRPTLKITANLTDWLKFATEGSYNYYYMRTEGKSLGSGYANEGGSYSLGLYTKEQTNLNATFTANKEFGDFNISGFLRGEYYNNYAMTTSMSTRGGLLVPGQYFINNSKETPSYNGEIQGEKTMMSIVGQAALSWKDQVYLEVTGRNDWSSALVYADKHGNYSYFYPSVSGSWLIHETLRDQLPEWISFAKIRASWAQVGNDTEAYMINSAYKIYTAVTNAGNSAALELPNEIYDANLKPERKNAWEIGLDWRFFNNRIGIDFTYYKENTTDQIMKISVPSVSGVSNQWVNAGNIQNAGVEIALNTTPISTKDWTWDLNFTYTRNRNKIISLHENVANYINLVGDPQYGNFRIGSVAKVGGDYGDLWSDATPFYDEKTGLPILETASYSARHAVYYSRSYELKKVGTMNPDFLGSVNTTLRYKNFSLRASLDMRFGGMVANYNAHYGVAYGFLESSLYHTDAAHGGITFKSIWDGETYDCGVIPDAIMPGGYALPLPDGTTYTIAEGGEKYADLVKAGKMDPQHASSWVYWNNSWGRAAVGEGISDDWFYELNYVALREISLSYQLPKKLAGKIGANNLSFTVAGRNLGYLYNSSPNNFSPEATRGTQSGQFLMRAMNPYVANLTFTLNATF